MGPLWELIYSRILDLSSVSFHDYVNIVGQYAKLTTKKSIDPRLLSKGYSEEALKKLQDNMPKSRGEIISLDLNIKGDLDRFNYPYFNYTISLFDVFDKHGALPYHGTYSEQPAKIIEVFHIFESLKIERENQIQDEHTREAQKQKKKK